MHCRSVVIADHRPVILLGLNELLRPEVGFNVVASCSDGTSCVEAVRRWWPDIAILDISMLGFAGPEIQAIAGSEGLPTRLVFLTDSIEEYELAVSVAEGAYGVIPRSAALDILLQSLRRVADGQTPLPLNAETQQPAPVGVVEDVLSVLTDREREIMGLVAQGLPNKEIARRLNIADGTIKVHLHRMFQKLEISNRTGLAALAISKR